MTPEDIKTPNDMKPGQDQTPDTKPNPLRDLGIHAAGDPDSAEEPEETDESYQAAHLGKTVFKPGELNNAGEDKEYFHPGNDHKFEVPKDANDHALTPDVEVTPDKVIKPLP